MDPFLKKQNELSQHNKLISLLRDCCSYAVQFSRTSIMKIDDNLLTADIRIYCWANKEKSENYNIRVVPDGKQNLDKLIFNTLEDFKKWCREENEKMEGVEERIQKLKSLSKEFA